MAELQSIRASRSLRSAAERSAHGGTLAMTMAVAIVPRVILILVNDRRLNFLN
jgi:hypothetical protein